MHINEDYILSLAQQLHEAYFVYAVTSKCFTIWSPHLCDNSIVCLSNMYDTFLANYISQSMESIAFYLSWTHIGSTLKLQKLTK